MNIRRCVLSLKVLWMLWVIMKMVMFNLCYRFSNNLCMLSWMFGLSVLNGLFSRRILGFLINVCVIVRCCCMLLDN